MKATVRVVCGGCLRSVELSASSEERDESACPYCGSPVHSDSSQTDSTSESESDRGDSGAPTSLPGGVPFSFTVNFTVMPVTSFVIGSCTRLVGPGNRPKSSVDGRLWRACRRWDRSPVDGRTGPRDSGPVTGSATVCRVLPDVLRVTPEGQVT